MKTKITFACSISIALSVALINGFARTSSPKNSAISRSPYIGAVVMDAETGQILFADNPGAKAYPASTLKLMTLLVVLDRINSGALSLQDNVRVCAKSSRIGGSQVYLKENEVFTVEELLYAMIIQSANDAATALAIHISGSKENFAKLMNRRAESLGMKNTEFRSPHGLPPGKSGQPDVTSARDMALLARGLLLYPDALRYTSAIEMGFRSNTFIMRTHNSLLKTFDGCDGMKTGFFRLAGYSIVATARRGNDRVIAVVLGSTEKKIRDAKAAELLEKGFDLMPAKPVKPAKAPAPAEDARPSQDNARRGLAAAAVISILAATAISFLLRWQHSAHGCNRANRS